MKTTLRKVLVCDDSMLIRKKLKEQLLANWELDVLEASDGQEAVELCLVSSPELVFLDIVMPKKNGLEALSEIKAARPETIVIMASSVGTEGNLKKAIDLGADDFIQKPLTLESVGRMIAKYMADREGQHV
ncbi:MAG: response regulator receiver protein [Paenibacillus sp.]|nr:response regulator receiver protein [Paenibacillus sp.]